MNKVQVILVTMMPLFERTAFHILPRRSSVVLGADLRREVPFTSRAEKLVNCHIHSQSVTP